MHKKKIQLKLKKFRKKILVKISPHMKTFFFSMKSVLADIEYG